MEGNFDLSKVTLEEFAGMIGKAMATALTEQNVVLAIKSHNVETDANVQCITEQPSSFDRGTERRDNEWGPDEPIFGYFHRQDPVTKCDQRLYEGDHAPFRSADAVHRFSLKNPGLFIMGGHGLLTAKAGEIYDALVNAKLRNTLKGGNIKINNKRK